ncbi:unnamed protein product, partial [marine sediment metagenome]
RDRILREHLLTDLALVFAFVFGCGALRASILARRALASPFARDHCWSSGPSVLSGCRAKA